MCCSPVTGESPLCDVICVRNRLSLRSAATRERGCYYARAFSGEIIITNSSVSHATPPLVKRGKRFFALRAVERTLKESCLPVSCRSGAASTRRVSAAAGDLAAAEHRGSVEPAAAGSGAVGHGPAAAAVAPGDGLRPQQPDERRDLPVPRVQRQRRRHAAAEPKAAAAKTHRLGELRHGDGPDRGERVQRQQLLLPPRPDHQREAVVDERGDQSQEHRRRLPRVQDQGQCLRQCTLFQSETMRDRAVSFSIKRKTYRGSRREVTTFFTSLLFIERNFHRASPRICRLRLFPRARFHLNNVSIFIYTENNCCMPAYTYCKWRAHKFFRIKLYARVYNLLNEFYLPLCYHRFSIAGDVAAADGIMRERLR